MLVYMMKLFFLAVVHLQFVGVADVSLVGAADSPRPLLGYKERYQLLYQLMRKLCFILLFAEN